MFGRTGRASVCVTKGGVLVHSYEPDCFETCTLHVCHALFWILEALPDCAAWFDAGSLKKLDRFPSVFSDQLDGPSFVSFRGYTCDWSWFINNRSFDLLTNSNPCGLKLRIHEGKDGTGCWRVVHVIAVVYRCWQTIRKDLNPLLNVILVRETFQKRP